MPSYTLNSSCKLSNDHKQYLLSGNTIEICKACCELGKANDTSAVKYLFTHIPDPKASTNLRFNGITSNHCRLSALTKISGLESRRILGPLQVNTAATLFYRNWAVANGFLKSKNEVDIYSHR